VDRSGDRRSLWWIAIDLCCVVYAMAVDRLRNGSANGVRGHLIEVGIGSLAGVLEPNFRFRSARNHTGSVALVVSCRVSGSKMPVVAQKRRRGRMTFLARRRRRLQRMGPYLSLLILLVPLLLVEPLKLVAVIIAGKGHWLTGTAVLVAAYAASLLVIERLFRVLKPKIMTIGWFNRLWTVLVAWRSRVMSGKWSADNSI
jgi:hypothetical protein